jgi:8-oxo-dGTP diphosphatase
MDQTPRSVAGIAIEQRAVFITRRKPGGALGGKWEFPGGKVETGEGDAQALIREYAEELGAAITVGPLIGTATFEYQGRHILHAYRVYFKEYRFILSEHTQWRWATLEEIQTLDFAGSDRKLLPALQAYLR